MELSQPPFEFWSDNWQIVNATGEYGIFRVKSNQFYAIHICNSNDAIAFYLTWNGGSSTRAVIDGLLTFHTAGKTLIRLRSIGYPHVFATFHVGDQESKTTNPNYDARELRVKILQ